VNGSGGNHDISYTEPSYGHANIEDPAVSPSPMAMVRLEMAPKVSILI
jgi:hypothetical protein